MKVALTVIGLKVLEIGGFVFGPYFLMVGLMQFEWFSGDCNLADHTYPKWWLIGLAVIVCFVFACCAGVTVGRLVWLFVAANIRWAKAILREDV